MKRTIFFIIVAVVGISISGLVFAARLQFEHQVEGKISAIDLAAVKPNIAVEYTAEGNNDSALTKQIKFRLQEDTKIADSAGSPKKQEELKVGDKVTVSYRKLYADETSFANIAEVITVQSLEENNLPRGDRGEQPPAPLEMYY